MLFFFFLNCSSANAFFFLKFSRLKQFSSSLVFLFSRFFFSLYIVLLYVYDVAS